MRAGTTSAKPLEVTSINGFLEHVEEIRSRKRWFAGRDEWGPWFRGQPEAALDLKPKLHRGWLPSKNDLREREDEIREEFIKRAPILCEAFPAGEETRAEWEWYFMMQHHHAATRLLDWTDGALIGLYFAVKDNRGHDDAAVWVLDPYEINKRAIGKEWVIPPSSTGLEPKYQKRLAQRLPRRFQRKYLDLPPRVVAIEPTHLVRRMSSQHSCFTIHGSDPEALEVLEREKNPCLLKIVILESAVKKIERELRGCGIDESTIFPDMDGLGRSINARWGIRDNGWPKK